MVHIKVEFTLGTMLHEALREARTFANANGVSLECTFNDQTFYIVGTMTNEDLKRIEERFMNGAYT